MINIELRKDLLIDNFVGADGKNYGNVNLGYLEKRAVSKYTFVGSDAGSGARNDISVWQPVLPSNQNKPDDASDWYFLGHVAVFAYNVAPTTTTYVVRQRFENKNRPNYTPSAILFGPDPSSTWRSYRNFWYFCPPQGCFALYACDEGGYSVATGPGLNPPDGDVYKMENFKILTPLYFAEFYKKYNLLPPLFSANTVHWSSDGSRIGTHTGTLALEHGLFIARQNEKTFNDWVQFKYIAEAFEDDPPVIRFGVAPAVGWDPSKEGF